VGSRRSPSAGGAAASFNVQHSSESKISKAKQEVLDAFERAQNTEDRLMQMAVRMERKRVGDLKVRALPCDAELAACSPR
jgi:hypothetical protein